MNYNFRVNQNYNNYKKALHMCDILKIGATILQDKSDVLWHEQHGITDACNDESMLLEVFFFLLYFTAERKKKRNN
jgi:hypothetical protein